MSNQTRITAATIAALKAAAGNTFTLHPDGIFRGIRIPRGNKYRQDNPAQAGVKCGAFIGSKRSELRQQRKAKR